MKDTVIPTPVLQAVLLSGVGSQIRALRNAQGISQRSLSQRLPISPSTLSRIEKGKTNMSLGLLWAISAALNCDLEIALLPADDSPPPD